MSTAAPWENDAPVSAAPSATSSAQAPWENDTPVSVTPKQTAAGAAQAVTSGLNAGSADLLGIPVDTARNIIELSKVVPGFVWHETTGKPIPEFLQPNTQPDIGSSEWIKNKLRGLEGNAAVDVAEDTTANRVIHGAGEAVPGSFVGNEAASTPGLVRAATSGAVAGAAQQGAVELGASDPVSQAVVGMVAGHATASRPKAAPTRTELGYGTTSTPDIQPSGFAAPQKPGAPDARLTIEGNSTAADATRQGAAPAPQIAHPDQAPAPAHGADTPDTEQASRKQTLRDVGLTEVRDSAVTGNTKEAGTDFQTSKLDNAAGERLSGVINKERSALQDYSRQITDASGGTRGLDNTALYNRGETIAKPVEQLSDYFDARTKEAYAAADQKAAGVPIDMSTTGNLLKNERSQFLATVEGKQLREGLQARMRDLGLMDEDGTVQPATVQQAERLKQFMSDAWSPRTSRLIGQMKGAIDDDVTRAAGSDIYQAARQSRALRATLLDDPTGIAKLAAPDDRLGINRTVPLEHIPDYVANLPVDQFGHIVKTLRDVPAEVQPAAAAALNEVRSHFANKVEAAGNSTQGMWNAKGANEYIHKNQMKMAEVFSPEEMQRFKTLADAGHILKMDRTYPGAAAQTHNLAVRGVLAAGNVAGKLGGIAGLVAGHGVEGGATGHVISSVAKAGVNKLADKALLAQAEKRIRKL